MFTMSNLGGLLLAVGMRKLAGAAQDAGNGARQIVGQTSSGDAGNMIISFLFGKVFPIIEGPVVFTLVLAAMISGCRLGASGIFDNPRGRMMAVIGLISAVVGAVIVFNCQTIISIAAGLTLGG